MSDINEGQAPAQVPAQEPKKAEKLAIVDTIKDGIDIGIKNIGPILVNTILWILTIWIPYINVGTTIGLFVGIIAKASRGEVISFTEVFDKQYRRYMGEYLLTAGLVALGVCMGCFFLIVPGVVISYAWSLALLLVIDKGKNPTEAITLSNNYTYGYKGKMFGVYILVNIAFTIVFTIFNFIPTVGVILTILGSIFQTLILIGIQASIYRQLTENKA
jgi:putative flippase GtrA